ncbi:phosphate acetyltransferase [Desulfonatronum thiosulfatophilum]|uniref:Phosphate acetyltransferase n=1 Tax=Desulfonatronum thiosulfatophilum TaxID=617002 RepID=A0A1G6EIX2_9BACT|nr:phosphate acetyltransferase [Desulfonatronum thiosulfatophilum]SDB57308.1 phosphate acetyltransferase [Desulfonatronum thiosulfatophilum]
MAKNLYVINTESRSGKSAICLGLMQMLMRNIRRVGFFRPIISVQGNGKRDHDTNLILSQFHLNETYQDAFAYSLEQARDLINQGEHAVLMENILAKYKALETRFDFILCEGSDFIGGDSAFEFDINAEVAANLGSPVILVANGQNKTPKQIVAQTQIAIDTFTDKGLDVLATIVNRAEEVNKQEIIGGLRCKYRLHEECLTYVIPEVPSLGKPTISDVKKWLDAEVVIGQELLDVQIDDYVVAAMQVNNFLEYVSKNSLVITPGDRSDILLGCIATRQSQTYPEVAGIVLTGGIKPPSSIMKLLEGWTGVPMPILAVQGHTYKITRILMEMYGRIEPEDQKKIATALGSFEEHVDTAQLLQRLEAKKSTKITPIMFEYSLIEKAKADRRHIVLPEGSSTRILQAADILLRRSIVDLTILGNPDSIRAKAAQMGLVLDKAEFIEPSSSELFDEYWQTYYEMRKSKGMTQEVAHDTMAEVTYYGTMMVQKGHADGMVSGSITTTQQTIRPALQFIKTRPGISLVSSVFFMCMSDRVLVFGDCAVNPNPTAKELAEIAVASAETGIQFGVEPRVAMLSYSTGESGTGLEVEKVREATIIAKQMAPNLLIEGPIQYDAAYDPDVAMTKMPDSLVAGRATVFIFPDLNTGNNTYKAVQRAANAVAIGPVLQGLNKPVNDLSRGCTVPDIVNTVAITAIQAQHALKAKTE